MNFKFSSHNIEGYQNPEYCYYVGAFNSYEEKDFFQGSPRRRS